MRHFVCGFMDCEASYIQSANALCSAAILAADAHHAFVDSGKVEDLDAFMDALAQWREAKTYPFPPYGSRTVH